MPGLQTSTLRFRAHASELAPRKCRTNGISCSSPSLADDDASRCAPLARHLPRLALLSQAHQDLESMPPLERDLADTDMPSPAADPSTVRCQLCLRNCAFLHGLPHAHIAFHTAGRTCHKTKGTVQSSPVQTVGKPLHPPRGLQLGGHDLEAPKNHHAASPGGGDHSAVPHRRGDHLRRGETKNSRR